MKNLLEIQDISAGRFCEDRLYIKDGLSLCDLTCWFVCLWTSGLEPWHDGINASTGKLLLLARNLSSYAHIHIKCQVRVVFWRQPHEAILGTAGFKTST